MNKSHKLVEIPMHPAVCRRLLDKQHYTRPTATKDWRDVT